MRGGWRGRAARTPRPARVLDEIEALTARNRDARDAAVDERLVRLRHEAFAELRETPLAVWPPSFSDPFPEVRDRPPEIPAAELSAPLLGGSIQHHGCLLVRGLFSPELVARLVADTDRCFRARADLAAGAPASDDGAWYVPFEPGPEWPALTEGKRKWVEECGAVWVADSPSSAFDVIEGLTAARIPEVVGGYLGEHPALSVNKCTLRRVPPGASGAWHQDGSFLGRDVRTVNVWVSLSDCGGESDAPGLAIVPRRMEAVLPTGVEGATSAISVGRDGITAALRGQPPCRPAFGPGDALLFDEMFLHCTGGKPGMTRDRYALESWFFTPSAFPEMYVPMVV